MTPKEEDVENIELEKKMKSVKRIGRDLRVEEL